MEGEATHLGGPMLSDVKNCPGRTPFFGIPMMGR